MRCFDNVLINVFSNHKWTFAIYVNDAFCDKMKCKTLVTIKQIKILH